MKKIFAITLVLIVCFGITTSASEIYTIQSGDVLWKIAKEHQLTLSELLNLNPSIKNQNLIYEGNTINVSKTIDKVDTSKKSAGFNYINHDGATVEAYNDGIIIA